LNRGTSDVRLFEMGHVFSAPSEESTKETPMLSIGATGNAMEAGAHGPGRAYSFFDLKGDIETILAVFDIRDLRFEPAEHFHPGRGARALADGMMVAEFGQVRPQVASARKMKPDIYLAEVYLDRLFALPLRVPRYQPLSKFPVVDRDFSFAFANSATFAQIQSAVGALQIAEMQAFQPMEVFRGGAVPEGKYSILLRAQFQSAERTLRDDEVAQWSERIVKALQDIGGALRT
jgi:phenylalanyl-tRNA synthetase beta chain